MEYIDLEQARTATGLRLVLLRDVPSPWSEAAKAIFELKQVHFLAVKYTVNDDAVRQWTGIHNAPVAVYDSEPPIHNWTEILALAERLQPASPLIPKDLAHRVEMFGLAHEVLGPNGLAWLGRLLLIEASLSTSGQCGFPVGVAEYLASKYGYAPGCASSARERIQEILSRLALQIGQARAKSAGCYLVGGQLSALDIYAATALGVFRPMSDEWTPLHPRFRKMLESATDHTKLSLLPELLEHREFIYRRHLGGPQRPADGPSTPAFLP